MRRLLLALPCALTLSIAGCGAREIAVEAASSPAGALPAGDISLVRDPGTGDVLAAWVTRLDSSWRIRFARSTDAGRSWSAPVTVTPEPDDASPPHGESSPRLVATSRGRLAIFWARSVPAPGRQWPGSEMRMARSLDGGDTWETPRTLNSDSTGAAGTHTFFGAAVLDDTTLVAAWLDERHPELMHGHQAPLPDTSHEPTSEADARIFAVTSHDFGESWGPNRALWGAVCPCCRVSLTPTADGRIIAAWRQHFPGNIRDIVTASLIPAQEPERLSHDNWSYPGCPHTGPAVAVDSSGSVHVVWYTGKEGGAGIFYARRRPGAAPSDPVGLATARTMATAHPSVALTSRGVLAAYDMSPKGGREIQLAWLDADGRLRQQLSVPASASGQYPQVTVLSDSTALVAWTQSDSVKVVRLALGAS
ncbi:MAG TPA: sialidase family protein [Gemmatimonadales bacterium]|nr:sialidase family protein [Gemmatimonadales bacterium]